MGISSLANKEPNKIAYTMATGGQVVTYGALDEAANRGAQLFRQLGLQRGDHIAILLENHPLFFQVVCAAQRSGLYYTTISWRLQQEEVEYIVKDCGAKLFITSREQKKTADLLIDGASGLSNHYMVDGVVSGFKSWEEAIAVEPASPIQDQSFGAPMLYSSGTTGYPKGVKRALSEEPYKENTEPSMMEMLYGADRESIYLSPAPLYHAAPMTFTLSCLQAGIHVIVMENFDAESALGCVERHKVTHSQWVPTMFVRMLKLPKERRLKYDLSSLRCAIHAAAPCPIPIKEELIRWWGPIVHEYYAGTEGNGFVQLNSQEWLEHKGSVGRPLNCQIHICDDEGLELSSGERGTIYFGGGGEFEYHNDRVKTLDAQHPEGWTTLGDVGYLDEEGYLYLTDRKHFMIISGGVNIYPQEAENILITHEKVIDVAVFGVPNEDFGEEVKGVVQLKDFEEASPLLAAQLIDFCREQLSHIKCPRSIDFRRELPRHPTGKLYKRLLKDEYE